MPAGPTGIQLSEPVARAQILGGALKVFAERGVRAASVADLLEAAKVSRRTFYRLYSSKEDVMVALYRLGTTRLVETCRVAIREETEPAKQIARCIDAHLTNTREFGRLVFVLGGEAQRHESALHARRMEVHDELVTMLSADHPEIDPLVFRAIVIALEGVSRLMLEEGDQGRRVSNAAVERVRRVMTGIATAALTSR